jgi:DNA repair exonuclease SbcCD ATPase subunit
LPDEPDAPDQDQGSEQPDPEPTGDGVDPAAQAKIRKANSEAKGLRARVKELEGKAARLDELETANQTEGERQAQALAAAERRAIEAEAKVLRLEVAANKGLTPAQAQRLVGNTLEELQDDADELLASFRPPEPEAAAAVTRPVPRLSGGSNPTEPPVEMDPMKLAAKIPRPGT